MKWLHTLALFVAYAAWRCLGLRAAGQPLARALANREETTRLVAGMLLVRGGTKALPLLRANLENDLALVTSLGVLGDVGGDQALGLVERYVAHPDAAVAHAAANARAAAALARAEP